jgi:hypothetical protein
MKTKRWKNEMFKEYYGMTELQLRRIVYHELHKCKLDSEDDVSDNMTILPNYITINYLKKLSTH